MTFLNCPTENMTSAPKTCSCRGAFLNPESDIDSSLFYVNVVLAATHSTFNAILRNHHWIVVFLITILIVYLVYRIYFVPVCYVKELTEVGFEHITGADRLTRISRAQALRRRGDKVPPPYPNGWFAVAESRDLKIGGVMAVDVLGQNLCVYRGEDGLARVVDAYCPHLGANLGVGGSVCGNCIECPFHNWKFNEKGACVHVPGQEKAPKGVSLKTWRSVEADGAVWIWHDAEERHPLWEMEDAQECEYWGYRGRNEFIVSAHIQELPENGADVAHLNAVHAPSMLSGLGEKYPFLNEIIGRHVWNAQWACKTGHTSIITLTHDYSVLGCNFFRTSLKINQIGPGHVRLRMDTPVGPFLLSQSVTPIGPLLQRVTNRLYSPKYNAFASWFIIVGEGKMIERDVQIWNNKRFVAAPTYVKTDKAIRAFRSWYSQFYSEHSLSYRDATQKPLDW